MRSIKTEIVVNAPVEKVWNILMDHGSYPQWNPFIKNISGNPDVGSQIAVTIQSPGNSPMDFAPTVLVNKTNQEFRWIGKLGIKGVFDGEHYFTLEQVGPNQTKFVHGENFTGLLSGIFMMMIREDTEKGFVLMNNALKQRSENLDN